MAISRDTSSAYGNFGKLQHQSSKKDSFVELTGDVVGNPTKRIMLEIFIELAITEEERSERRKTGMICWTKAFRESIPGCRIKN